MSNNSITISPRTIEILKNFSTISGNILFEKDEEYLKIMSPLKNLFGHAKIEERFPQEFSILELKNFLEALTMFETPILTFEGDYVIISSQSGLTDFKYYQSAKKFLQVNEKPYRELPSAETFSLTEQVLASVIKATGIIGGDILSLQGSEGKLVALITDKKDRTNTATNNFKTIIGETPNNFSINVNTSNLKLLPADYTGHIIIDPSTSKPKVLRLIDKDEKLIYTIAVEETSTYEK